MEKDSWVWWQYLTCALTLPISLVNAERDQALASIIVWLETNNMFCFYSLIC